MFYVYHYIVVLSYCSMVLLLVDIYITYHYYRIMMYHFGFLYTHCVLHMVTISMLRDSEETVLNWSALVTVGALTVGFCWIWILPISMVRISRKWSQDLLFSPDQDSPIVWKVHLKIKLPSKKVLYSRWKSALELPPNSPSMPGHNHRIWLCPIMAQTQPTIRVATPNKDLATSCAAHTAILVFFEARKAATH